ncbi:hypothetical protein BASA81_000176 [Batrachochytrium salamandrivorans]|nr:hypothetical protein BASA81_000176 [Batrachochytrium salamandrivorans]
MKDETLLCLKYLGRVCESSSALRNSNAVPSKENPTAEALSNSLAISNRFCTNLIMIICVPEVSGTRNRKSGGYYENGCCDIYIIRVVTEKNGGESPGCNTKKARNREFPVKEELDP